VSDAILMASGADDIDFMIHGLFSYELFGHKVWITCMCADRNAGIDRICLCNKP